MPNPVEEELEAAVRDAERRFLQANPQSRAHYLRAVDVLAGGQTRHTLLHEPFPLTMKGGEGASLEDLDGHRYLDFVGDFAAGVYGHSCATIRSEAAEAMARGMSLGAVTEKELEFAEFIRNRIPSMQLIRFCNSGTEACLLSTLLARHATKRDRLLVFKGAYHGGFMVYGEPQGSLNVPLDVVSCTYNDVHKTRAAIRANASALAAVIVEPMMGAGGCIPATQDFLGMLRDETRSCGTLLIFDEVMTSRLSPGGLQSHYRIEPDVTTLGKFWGGGFNFGAFGGSAAIMRHFDTFGGGRLSHGGTFNNNAVTLATGLAGARQVYSAQACVELNERGDRLRGHLNTLGQRLNVPLQLTGLGAVMNFHWHRRPVTCPADTEAGNSLPRRLFQLEMMLAGFYVAQRGLLTLSLAHSDADLDRFADAVEHHLRRFGSCLQRFCAA